MRLFKWITKLRLTVNLKRSLVLGVLAMVLIAATSPQAIGQSPAPTSQPSPSPTNQSTQKLPNFLVPGLGSSDADAKSSEIATGEVSLDGRKLFAIAAPAVNRESKQQSVIPIQERVNGIEAVLNRVVQNGFDPKKLNVVSSIDPSSALPVITINDQYLMTVTTLDAQVQGREPSRQAEILTGAIKSALIRARQERQPDFITGQSLLAAQILVGVLLVSWGVSRLQERLKVRRQQLKAQTPIEPEVTPNTADAADASTATAVQQQITKLRQRNLNDVQQRLLQLLQVGLWGGGMFIILGLFPYSRWLQPLVLSGPLRVLTIILATYVMIRVVDVVLDRAFIVLEDTTFIDPARSQRVALRFSTFSRVLKSVVAIIFVGAGAIAILSVVGVELGPVLAGAGIIGLAISFAAQSLVKDMINGLLILFEDQYAVGDVIAVGTVSGLVEHMNLRITQLRNAEGRLITIPNSSITVVENLSKDWSRVDLAIAIAYDADIDQALAVIRKVGEQIMQDPQWKLQIPEHPEVLGVDQIDNTGVTVRVWIKTQPLQQWNVAREFRRRLKIALDEKGISIGVPQQTLRFRDSLDLNERIMENTGEKAWHPTNPTGDTKK